MIVFDVGANNGSTFSNMFGNPEIIIYQFEPTPILLETDLYPNASKYENIIVVPKAVDIANGQRVFNLALNPAVNSLYEFSDYLEFTWPGRSDCRKYGEMTVDCVRMDTFCIENNITQIDIFHCDTQGNDLNVLKSFGDIISIIQQGVVEACNQNPLYKKMNNGIATICKFLEGQGFQIDQISDNDPLDNEKNIHFSRRI